jgi:cell division septation protein DedD
MNDEKPEQGTPAEENEFVFDGGSESTSGREKDIIAETLAESGAEERPRKNGGRSRLLLLLLLVVAGAGAAFYLFGQDLFAPAQPVAQVERQKPSKMKVPERPQPVKKPEAVKDEVVSQAKIAAIIPTPPTVPALAPVPVPVEIPAPVPVFALTAGSYLYKSNVNRVNRQVEKLGYKTTTSQSFESHEMTRLLVGRYPKSLAKKRLAKIQKFSDGAFIVAEGGKYVVYAGSFLSLDKARRLADLLYQQGVKTEERQAMVDLPRTTLRFGGFATRAEARKVVQKLEKLGVERLRIVPFK